jgi:hypothetical protein
LTEVATGRRSLSALAAALGASLDQVAGIATPPARGLEHNALAYASDDEPVRGAVPFLVDGVDRSEWVLVALRHARRARHRC